MHAGYSQEGSAAEWRARRIGPDVDYGAAPWRLACSSTCADAAASTVQLYAWDLIMDGMDTYYVAQDPDRCWADDCGEIASAGSAMWTLGETVQDFPLTFNYNIIGGVPNDGLLPTANEALPDKLAFRTVPNLTHNEVLGDGVDIVQAVNHLTGR